MIDPTQDMPQRLKVSDLLGKSEGDFLDRVEHSGCIDKLIVEMTDQELEAVLGVGR